LTKLDEYLKSKGLQLEHKQSMINLHNARNNLKHQANWPHPNEIENFRVNTTNFIDDNITHLYGLNLSTVSLVDMIECEDCRNELKGAEQSIAKGEYQDAIDSITIGFQMLINYYDRRMDKGFWERSVEEVDPIKWDLKIIGFGLDYRRYYKFSKLTPKGIIRGADGQILGKDDQIISSMQAIEKKVQPNIKICRFCLNFVIDSALRLQEFDFSL